MTAEFVKQLPGKGFTVRARPGPNSDYTTGMATARSRRHAQKNGCALQPERDGEGVTIPRQAAPYQIVYARWPAAAGETGRLSFPDSVLRLPEVPHFLYSLFVDAASWFGPEIRPENRPGRRDAKT
jgi:hypothetical protein